MEPASHALDEWLRRCTVRVESGSGHGTGFFVALGRVLPCAHVVEDAHKKTTPVKVYYAWQDRQYLADIVTCLPTPYPDLAVLRVEIQDHPCVYLHAEADLRDHLYTYGYTDDYPDGDSATFEYEGPAGEEAQLLKLKIGQARPGLSGAPLLNLRTGGVCGIVKSTRDRSLDLGGRAVPISVILAHLSDLAAWQQTFHAHDPRWVDSLSPQQRQQLPWGGASLRNPFYGESPRLLGREEERQRIEEKLRAGNHCSITGPPGSGKSLMLRTIREDIPTWLGYQPQQILPIGVRGIGSLRELQELIVAHLGGEKANEWRSLLRLKPLRILLLDDLGGMDAGRRGLEIRRWLRGLDDSFGVKLLMVSNERLDILFRKDDPSRDSPLQDSTHCPFSSGRCRLTCVPKSSGNALSGHR
jgi:Trypsin-like peptidase domain